MKSILSGVFIAATLLLAACSTSTEPSPNDKPGPITDPKPDPKSDPKSDPKPDGPSIKKQYDSVRHGVQITGIYFHQDSNFIVHNLRDEWIILESDEPVATKGWMLDASDNQQFPLPDTIHRKLYIYTLNGPGYENDTVMILGRKAGAWIWNNSEPDTGKVIDNMKTVIDSITYKAKR